MNQYISVNPKTLEIVDRFVGTLNDVKSRSSKLEHVIVPPNLDFNFVIPIRDSITNKITFTINTEALEAETRNRIQTKWKLFRGERSRRLAECDWVTLRAYSTDTPIPEEWKVYMQALRDLPSVTEDPANPVWPVQPTAPTS